MTIASVSDLHGFLDFQVPKCDVLTISGDICPVIGSHSPTRQETWLRGVFFPWCQKVLASGTVRRAIVMTPGNHDFVFERRPGAVGEMVPDGVHVLVDKSVEIEGVMFYGTPWVPIFGGWAFMADDAVIGLSFDRIHRGTDILLTHGPAWSVCDRIAGTPDHPADGRNLGSRTLLSAVKRVSPAWHLFGHIHTGSHSVESVQGLSGITRSVNVSLLDESYKPSFTPFVFTFDKNDRGTCGQNGSDR